MPAIISASPSSPDMSSVASEALSSYSPWAAIAAALSASAASASEFSSDSSLSSELSPSSLSELSASSNISMSCRSWRITSANADWSEMFSFRRSKASPAFSMNSSRHISTIAVASAGGAFPVTASRVKRANTSARGASSRSTTLE